MGGAVVAEFVARHPERVRSAVFIAPAGLSGELPAAWLAAPLLGDWVFRVLGPSLLGRMAERELREASHADELVAAYRRQAAYAGYEPALLSTARHFPLTGATAAWDAVGRSGRPVLAFWGTRDPVVPFERSRELLRRVPQARLRALEGMTHAVTYAHPEAILPELIRFLDSTR
jgi:pimeloyl-ACP methyl ester carboxylesterase